MKVLPKATTVGVGALNLIVGVCFLPSPKSKILVGLNLKLCIGVFKGLKIPVSCVCGEGFLLTAKLENELLLRNDDIEELVLGDLLELADQPVDASLGPRTLKLLRESIQLTDNDWD